MAEIHDMVAEIDATYEHIMAESRKMTEQLERENRQREEQSARRLRTGNAEQRLDAALSGLRAAVDLEKRQRDDADQALERGLVDIADLPEEARQVERAKLLQQAERAKKAAEANAHALVTARRAEVLECVGILRQDAERDRYQWERSREPRDMARAAGRAQFERERLAGMGPRAIANRMLEAADNNDQELVYIIHEVAGPMVADAIRQSMESGGMPSAEWFDAERTLDDVWNRGGEKHARRLANLANLEIEAKSLQSGAERRRIAEKYGITVYD